MITETSFFGLPLRTPAQRRLLVVLYYALLLVVVSFGFAYNKRLPIALGIQTFVFGGLLGGIRAGGPVKAYTEPHFGPEGEGDTRPIVLGLNAARERVLGPRYWTPLDERETGQRDRAHFVAYRLLIWIFCIAAAAYWCAWAWLPERMEHEAPLLVWLLLVVTVSLPQAVLLWTEPAPIPEDAEPSPLHA